MPSQRQGLATAASLDEGALKPQTVSSDNRSSSCKHALQACPAYGDGSFYKGAEYASMQCDSHWGLIIRIYSDLPEHARVMYTQ